MRIQLIDNTAWLLLTSVFFMIGCSNVPNESKSENLDPISADKSQEVKSENRYPVIEIWQELEGSVAIPGKSLYFRLYDDGAAEFDYQVKEPDASGYPRHTYSLQKAHLSRISEEEFREFKSLSEDLTKSKGIKPEYKTVGLTFDVFTKLTILLNEKDSPERKIIINNADLDVIDVRFEKTFPPSLIALIKEIRSLRLQTSPDGR